MEVALQSELLDLEMTLLDIDHREKRRRAWPRGWTTLEDAFPTTPAKISMTLRLDADLAKWFRDHGRGYQTRMNAVLRAYMLTRMTKLDCSGKAAG